MYENELMALVKEIQHWHLTVIFAWVMNDDSHFMSQHLSKFSNFYLRFEGLPQVLHWHFTFTKLKSISDHLTVNRENDTWESCPCERDGNR